MVSVFDGIDGLRPVDPADLAEYERAMTEEVIPQLLKEQNRKRWPQPAAAGWMCPNCGRAHSPEITTCPHDNRTLGERLRNANK